MGQKVNPTSLRVGINKYWQSTWFEKKDYSNFLKEDFKICLLYTSPSPRDPT